MIRYTIFIKWLVWTIALATFILGPAISDKIKNYDLYSDALFWVIVPMLLPIFLFVAKTAKHMFMEGGILSMETLKRCGNQRTI